MPTKTLKMLDIFGERQHCYWELQNEFKINLIKVAKKKQADGLLKTQNFLFLPV